MITKTQFIDYCMEVRKLNKLDNSNNTRNKAFGYAYTNSSKDLLFLFIQIGMNNKAEEYRTDFKYLDLIDTKFNDLPDQLPTNYLNILEAL